MCFQWIPTMPPIAKSAAPVQLTSGKIRGSLLSPSSAKPYRNKALHCILLLVNPQATSLEGHPQNRLVLAASSAVAAVHKLIAMAVTSAKSLTINTFPGQMHPCFSWLGLLRHASQLLARSGLHTFRKGRELSQQVNHLRKGKKTMKVKSIHLEGPIFGCGSKNRYQNGTLASGTMDQNLRNPSCLIWSHSHLTT